MTKLSIIILFLLFFTSNSFAQDLTQFSYKELDSLVLIPESAGDYMACIPYMQAGRDKAKAEFGQMDSTYARYTSDLGYFYEEMGIYEKAEPLFEEAAMIIEKVFGKEHRKFANALILLANLQQGIGNYEKAESLFIQSKNIRAKILGENHLDYAVNLNNLAIIYQYMGQYEKAEPLLLQAKEIRAKALGEEHEDFATTLNILGVLYYNTGHYEKAEPILLQAKNIRAKIYGEEHPAFARSLNNLATLYTDMELYEKAEPLFIQCTKIISKTVGELHPEYAGSLHNLASLYKDMKEYEKAEELYFKTQQIKIKILGAWHPDLAVSLNNLASLYKDMKQYEKAEPLYIQAKNIWEKSFGTEHPNFAIGLNNLADLYLFTGKLDTALSYSIQSIRANSAEIDSSFSNFETLDKFHYYSNQQINHTMIVLMNILKAQFQKTGDKTKLESHYKIAQAAMRLNERIRNEFGGEGDKLRSLATNSRFVLEGIKTALLLKKKDYQQEAFGFAELNKGVLLMDAAKTERAYKFGDLPDSLATQEKKLQKKYSDLQAKILKKNSPAVKDSLDIVLTKLNHEIDAFSKNIKDKYPKYAAIKYENKTAKAADIQALLDDKTALLEYVIGDSTVYIFYIDKTKVELYTLEIGRDILKNKIQKLHFALSNYDFIANKKEAAYRDYTDNAYWFYKNLLAPALDNAKQINKLIVISDGELGHLPFEAFLVKAPQQKTMSYKELDYLIKYYKISYNYAATLWMDNKTSPHKPNNGAMLAMAGNYDIKLDQNKSNWRLPIYQRQREGLIPLPAARKEVEVLAERFEGFFGFDLQTSEKIFKEKASEYSVIHLAMHGLLDSKAPILSSLAFTEDSDSLENNFLQVYEISKMQLNADLVVLSACETGYGKFEKGNGIASLARAFMYAGTPALIVSLWQVNDYATAEIMKTLYDNLANGMDKDEALQQAKIDYVKRAKDIAAHPAFWSSFVLMGSTDYVHLDKKTGYLFWVLGAIGLFGLFGGLYWKSRKQ